MSAIFSNEVVADVTGQTITVVQPTGTNLHTVVDSGNIEISNDAGNPIPVTLSQAAGTPTVSRVAVSTTVATLALADPTRSHVIIHNETGVLFVKLGTNATSTDYTYRLTGNTTVDIDFTQTEPVTAIKATGTSDAQVTEIA